MEPITLLAGRVGQTPQLRATRGGVPFTRFRVAHTPRLLRDGEWSDGDTTWVTVLCYRSLAENVCRSLRKGEPVVVSGRTRVESWVDDVTHAARESVTIDARAVGHDLSLGSTHFTRIRREPSGEQAGEGGAEDTRPTGSTDATDRPGDTESEAVGRDDAAGGAVPEAEDRVLVPF